MSKREGEAPLPLSESELRNEQHLLGSLLIEPQGISQVASSVSSEDFGTPAHGIIYDGILTCAQTGEGTVDVVRVIELLRENDLLNEAGGSAAITRLLSTPREANLSSLVGAQRAASERRRVAESFATGLELLRAGRAARTAVESVEPALADALSGKAREGFSHGADGTNEVLKSLLMSPEEARGVFTGVSVLDECLAKSRYGMQGGDLHLLAARPGEGKSALMAGIALNVARYQKRTVAIMSLEMPTAQVVRRLLSILAGFDVALLRRPGRCPSVYWHLALQACIELNRLPIYIDDSGSLNPPMIRARCKRLKEEVGLGLMCIDYLQLLNGGREMRNKDPYEVVSYVSRATKEMAMELDVPILALCQLSRKVEDRADRRPQLSDLRETGHLEQDADYVSMIWGHPDGNATLLLEKNRHGPRQDSKLAFVRPTYSFLNLPR